MSRYSRRYGVIGVSCACLVGAAFLPPTRAQTGPAETARAEKAEPADDHAHPDAFRVRSFTLRVDGKSDLVRDAKGGVQWVPAAARERPAPVVRRLSGDEAVVVVDCRTTPTSTSGRKTCGDDEVHTLPEGYVFVENEARTEWHSAIGSENRVDIAWEDRVEVIPGTGILQARTMRVHGHARSGRGFGERGHTHATVRCRFVRYVR